MKAPTAILGCIPILLLAGSAGATIVPFVEIPELGGCGTAQQAGFVGDIQATAVTQQVDHQVDEKTGLPTGAKLSRSLAMFKPLDSCTPALFLAAVNVQRLTVHVYFVENQDMSVRAEIISTASLVTRTHVTPGPGGAIEEFVEFGLGGMLTIINRPRKDDGSPGPVVTRCWDFVRDRPC